MRYLLFLFLLFLCTLTFGQKSVKVQNQIRIISYYDLRDDANKGFFKYRQELPKLLLEATANGQITAYDVAESSNPKEISYIDIKEKLTYTTQDWNDEFDITEEYYYPESLSLFGVDKTIGLKGKKRYEQINFINIYLPEYESIEGFRKYICSYRFEDFKNLCNENDWIWYNVTMEHFYNSNVMTNLDGNYTWDSGIGHQLINGINQGKITGFNKNGDSKIPSLAIPEDHAISLAVKETNPGNGMTLDIYSNNDYSFTAPNPQYLISVRTNELLKNHTASGIMYLADAIQLGKLNKTKDYQVPTDTLALDGQLNDGTKDPTYNKGILKLPASADQLNNRSITYAQSSLINFNDSMNNVLMKNEKFVNLLLGAVESGKVKIYRDDSLKVPLSKTQFQENISMRELLFDPDTGEEFEDLIIFSPESMSLAVLTEEVTYHLGTEKKTSTPKALTLMIAPEQTITGLIKYIGSFDMNEIKELLESEWVEFNGKQMNFYQVITSNELRRYYQFSSHLELLPE